MPRTLVDNLDVNKNQLLNALLQIIAGNHGSPVEGIIWYDSSAKAIKFHDGTAVKTLGVAGSGGDADTLDGNDSAFFLSRANHTGTQPAATISDFAAAVLGVSGIATDTEVANQIAALVDASPDALNTLNELAAALGDDPNFAATINTALAQRTRKYSQDIGNGALTSIAVSHNLGTRDVVVSVRRLSDHAEVYPGVVMTDANTVTLSFTNAPANASLRVTVVG